MVISNQDLTKSRLFSSPVPLMVLYFTASETVWHVLKFSKGCNYFFFNLRLYNSKAAFTVVAVVVQLFPRVVLCC